MRRPVLGGAVLPTVLLLVLAVGCTAAPAGGGASVTDPSGGAATSVSPAAVTSSASGGAATSVSPAAVTSAAVTSSASAGAFVTTQGRNFVLAGRPFRFVGVNIYDAAASAKYSCRAGSMMSPTQLLDTMRYLHDHAGATVLRFWAYQTYTQSATYFDGMDRVLADAKELNMKVIPVLEDGPGNCTTNSITAPKSAYDGDTWFQRGYHAPYGNATLSYRDYAKKLTAHYADNPVILGWSLMNEADTSQRDELTRPILVDFATDMVGVIKSVDPNHLITVGTQSNGAPGASGPDFTAVYSVPGIAFAEVHDWGYWGSDTEPMPGGQGAAPPAADSSACRQESAPIGCSFARAVALDKPLIVGEAGITGVTADQRASRAKEFQAKMTAAFGAGASGYLVWSVTMAETDGYDVHIDDDDPLLPVMLQIAGGLQ